MRVADKQLHTLVPTQTYVCSYTAEKIKYVHKNLQKKQCIEVPQHQQTYRYVGLFLIETLKHSNTTLEYSVV
jgi:hypothetical protein